MFFFPCLIYRKFVNGYICVQIHIIMSSIKVKLNQLYIPAYENNAYIMSNI